MFPTLVKEWNHLPSGSAAFTAISKLAGSAVRVKFIIVTRLIRERFRLVASFLD